MQVTNGSACGNQPRVYIVILNWNGWSDTIACVESVLQQDYENFRVIICDNGSTDDSVAQLLKWAAASLPMRGRKDRAFTMITVDEKAAGQFRDPITNGDLILLKNHRNLGFAGGNNAGLKLALACGDLDYAWLLNNDTVVQPSSLPRLIEKIQSRAGIGICGSTLLCDDERQTVQARGATYHKWFSRTRNVGLLQNASQPIEEDAYAQKMDYVVGASMMVSKPFLETIGLMSEEYFLYFEELDWTLRARGKYSFAYASRSMVYHKGGASTGADLAKKSLIGEYYGTRGRLLFTRKFYPYALPTVLLAITLSLFIQVCSGHFKIARTILAAVSDGLRGRVGVRANA